MIFQSKSLYPSLWILWILVDRVTAIDFVQAHIPPGVNAAADFIPKSANKPYSKHGSPNKRLISDDTIEKHTKAETPDASTVMMERKNAPVEKGTNTTKSSNTIHTNYILEILIPNWNNFLVSAWS